MNATIIEIPADVLAKLRFDGDTADLPDGRTVRLHIEPDTDTSVDDFDYYGRTEWGKRNHDTGRSVRPSSMNGNAEILDVDGSYRLWWQPPADVKRSDPGFRELRSQVLDLVTYGFSTVGLTVHETVTDSLGHEHLVEVASGWIGGVDDTSSEYMADILSEIEVTA